MILAVMFTTTALIPLEVFAATATKKTNTTVKKTPTKAPVKKVVKKKAPTKKVVKKKVNLNPPMITLATAPHSAKPAPKKKVTKKTTTVKKPVTKKKN